MIIVSILIRVLKYTHHGQSNKLLAARPSDAKIAVQYRVAGTACGMEGDLGLGGEGGREAADRLDLRDEISACHPDSLPVMTL